MVYSTFLIFGVSYYATLHPQPHLAVTAARASARFRFLARQNPTLRLGHCWKYAAVCAHSSGVVGRNRMHLRRFGCALNKDDVSRCLCGTVPDRVAFAIGGDGLRADAHACEKLMLIEQTP